MNSYFTYECPDHGIIETVREDAASSRRVEKTHCPRQLFQAGRDGEWYFCGKPLTCYLRNGEWPPPESMRPSVHAIVPPTFDPEAGSAVLGAVGVNRLRELRDEFKPLDPALRQRADEIIDKLQDASHGVPPHIMADAWEGSTRPEAFDPDEWERQQRGLLDDAEVLYDQASKLDPDELVDDVRAVIDDPKNDDVVLGQLLRRILGQTIPAVDGDWRWHIRGEFVSHEKDEGTCVGWLVDERERVALERALAPTDPEDDPDSDTHWFEPDAYEDLKADLFDAYRAQAAPVAATMRILDVLEKHGVSIGVK